MSLSPSDARLFRERLAEIRKAKGFTQIKLSEAIGKAPTYISRVETGEINTPPLDTIAEIAKQLDVPIGELFSFQGKGDSAEQLRARIQRLIAIDDAVRLRKYYRLLLIATEK
jgi:transcriptional regulator with XRE-family HTH domain